MAQRVSPTQPISTKAPLTNQGFAAALGINARSLDARVCRTGSYHGVMPIKGPNGRVYWPADAVQQLLGGGV